MTGEKLWDTLIIGAGAAGLMTAITARRAGLEVLLLDGREKIGAKILMSGGTRCNLTNSGITEKDFQSEQKKIVSSVLKSFTSEQALRFFEAIGVEAVLEPGGKYFPSTHSGRTVLEALVRETEKTGVCLASGKKVTKCFFQDGVFTAEGKDFKYSGRTLALTTGGLSYPTTGSDGTGYGLAQSFGHRRVDTSPALTPLNTDDADWKKLSGVTLPVRLTLWEGDRKKAVYEDSFLFTHFGFSGPAALDISRHWIRGPERDQARLTACFLPDQTEEQLRSSLAAALQKQPQTTFKNFLSGFLPQRFTEIFMHKFKVPENVSLSELKKEYREAVLKGLFYCPLSVTGAVGYSKAEVTAGGIDLAEVHRLTLESKLRPGLFFAGEILDVDGRIGGFNFQWAWSSGVAAGNGVAKRIG